MLQNMTFPSACGFSAFFPLHKLSFDAGRDHVKITCRIVLCMLLSVTADRIK